MVATHSSMAKGLARNWRKAAWFYARFGITEGQFRGGVPTESSGVLDKPRATLLRPSLAGTGALQ